jgi:hypothetical protein
LAIGFDYEGSLWVGVDRSLDSMKEWDEVEKQALESRRWHPDDNGHGCDFSGETMEVMVGLSLIINWLASNADNENLPYIIQSGELKK